MIQRKGSVKTAARASPSQRLASSSSQRLWLDREGKRENCERMAVTTGMKDNRLKTYSTLLVINRSNHSGQYAVCQLTIQLRYCKKIK